MRGVAVFLGGVLLAGAAQACAYAGDLQGKPLMHYCPPSVVDYAERAVQCKHYSGEFGGGGSTRDAEVAAEMERLNCGSVENDKALIHEQYKRDKNVLKAMQTLSERFGVH